MDTYGFGDYIKFLRENFSNVIKYKENSGSFEPSLTQVNEDLFDQDPFVVYGASVIATAVFADDTLYH